MSESEIVRVLRDIESASVKAAAAIRDAGLRVDSIEAEFKTTFESETGFEFDLKLVKVGVGASTESVNTISVAFSPRTAALAAGGLDKRLEGAVGSLEEAIAAVSDDFALSTATAEFGVTVAANGEVSVVLRGDAKRSETHSVKINFVPQ